MSYCDNCLHREVCGIENAGDEAMTYCCDKVGWIQVSERLPGDSGTYLVTVHDGRKKRTTFARYQKKLKNWVMTGARAYWRVKAWMPLPEPYEPQESEGY